MAIALRAYSGNYAAGGVTSLTITKPAGVVSGDVLVCIIVSNQTTNNTAPAGWTAIDSYIDNANGSDTYNSFYKVAGSSEPASYTFTTGAFPGASIAAYSGVDNTTPINAHNIKFSGTQPFASTAVTTTVTNCWIIGGFSSESGGGTAVTVNSGWTIDGQNNDSIDAITSMLAHQAQAATGTSATMTVSGDGGSFSGAYMIALTPSGASPPPTPAVSTYTSFFSFY